MSFILQNLGKISATANADAPTMYSYTHPTDDLATITAADYFIERIDSLKVKDILKIVASDDNGTFIINQLTPTLTVEVFGDVGFITSINTANLTVTAGPPGQLDTTQDINVSASPTFVLAKLDTLGVGTSAPATSAIVELFATDRALLLTRLTTTQRDAMTNQPDGMIIYNSTTNAFNGRANGAWVAL